MKGHWHRKPRGMDIFLGIVNFIAGCFESIPVWVRILLLLIGLVLIVLAFYTFPAPQPIHENGKWCRKPNTSELVTGAGWISLGFAWYFADGNPTGALFYLYILLGLVTIIFSFRIRPQDESN